MPFKFSPLALPVAALAGMLALGGAAMWFRAALDQSFERGRAAGNAEFREQHDAEMARRAAASVDALAQSQRDAAKIEIERDRIRDQFDEFREKVGKSAGRNAACLDPDVVRALDSLGLGTAGPAAGP